MKELFIDIETAPIFETLEEYPEVLRDKLIQKYDDQAYEKAGLHAEFGKIVCISVGYIKGDEVITKSFYDENISTETNIFSQSERTILSQFASTVGKGYKYVGHNILDFDIPFIQRRMAINRVDTPSGLITKGKKPWDLDSMFADTMVMWSSTQWKYRVSLNVLCGILGVTSPKSSMDGSMVGKAYYGGRMREVADYCERDIVSTAKVYKILKESSM